MVWLNFLLMQMTSLCWFYFAGFSGIFFSTLSLFPLGGWALRSLLYPKTSLWWCQQNEASFCNVSCQQSSSREFDWNQQELQGVHRGTSSSVHSFHSHAVWKPWELCHYSQGEFHPDRRNKSKLSKEELVFVVLQVNTWWFTKTGYMGSKSSLK